MLTKKNMIGKATEMMIELFGIEYMREHMFNNCCHAQSEDGDYFELFCGFVGDKETNKWTEFAYVHVHKETGEAEALDYKLPDGTRMKNPIKLVRCA